MNVAFLWGLPGHGWLIRPSPGGPFSALRAGHASGGPTSGRWFPRLPSPGCPLCRLRRHSPCAPDPGSPRRGLPGPEPRVTFCTHKKSPKKRRGDPGPPFLSNRSLRDCYRAATEIPLCLRLPRNRCGRYPTSAVAPRADRCFYLQKTRFACLFNRASAEAGRETRRRSDAKESDSVAKQYQI